MRFAFSNSKISNDIYKPFVAPFVQTLTEDVFAPLVAEEDASSHYMFGLDVAPWLSRATD